MEKLEGRKSMIIVIVLICIFGIGCLTIGIISRNKKINEETKTENKPSVNLNMVDGNKTSDRSMDKIVMTIKEGTLTKTGATVLIKDSNEEPYSYGEWYRIDKKENGKWEELETIDGKTVPEIALPMLEYGDIERTIDWTNIYGELESGEYRIVKRPVGVDTEIYVEFNI